MILVYPILLSGCLNYLYMVLLLFHLDIWDYPYPWRWRRSIIGGLCGFYCSMPCALVVMSLTYGHNCTGTTSWDAAPHLVGCAGRSHFALHSYAFVEDIKVTCPCHYEALSYSNVLNWKSIIYIDIISCLFYKWNSRLNHCLI